jgi:hypothetical protein
MVEVVEAMEALEAVAVDSLAQPLTVILPVILT